MRVHLGLALILVALADSGSSLTCYSNENGTESECNVPGPDLHQAIMSKDSEKIRGICYTFEILEGSGDNKRSEIYLGCSSEDKQTTCDNLKEKYLLGKNSKSKALTSCYSCNQDLCNIDPSESVTWIEEQRPSNRGERQWFGKSKTSKPVNQRPPVILPTPTTTVATTPNPLNEQTTEEEIPKELTSPPTPDQDNNNKEEEILGRAAPWGNTINNQNRNPQFNNRVTTKYPSNRNEEYTTPRVDSQEEENFNQDGRQQPGNGHRPGGNNFGQQTGNGQRPGGNNFGGQPGNGRPGGNNFGGQPGNGRPAGNNFGGQQPGNGQPPGGNNNFGQTQRPGEGDNNFGGQPNGFDREDKYNPSTGQVGKKPDGSYGTGVQYATKHPTLVEIKPTSYPPNHGHGGIKQPLEGHQRPTYNSKDPHAVPKESSASNLNNVAIFVVSVIFMINFSVL